MHKECASLLHSWSIHKKNSKKTYFLDSLTTAVIGPQKTLSFHLTTYIHHCIRWFYFLFPLHWPRFTATSFNSYNFSHNNFPLTKTKVYIAASVNVTRAILQIFSNKFNSNWCFWFSFNKPPLCSYSRLHHIRSGKPSALAAAQFYEPNALPLDQLPASKRWTENMSEANLNAKTWQRLDSWPLWHSAQRKQSASVWTGPVQSVLSVQAGMSWAVLVPPRDTPTSPCYLSRPVV